MNPPDIPSSLFTQLKCEHCGKKTPAQGNVCTWCGKPVTTSAKAIHWTAACSSGVGAFAGAVVGGPIGLFVGFVAGAAVGGVTAAVVCEAVKRGANKS